VQRPARTRCAIASWAWPRLLRSNALDRRQVEGLSRRRLICPTKLSRPGSSTLTWINEIRFVFFLLHLLFSLCSPLVPVGLKHIASYCSTD
jgi:hypothetical protein